LTDLSEREAGSDGVQALAGRQTEQQLSLVTQGDDGP
jgi:hypothetical protein